MSYKIKISGSFFVITDTIRIEDEIREVSTQVKWKKIGSLYYFMFNNMTLPENSESNLGLTIKEFDFADIVDGTGVAFGSVAIFENFLNINTGNGI